MTTARPASQKAGFKAVFVQWGKYRFERQFLAGDTTGQAHRALEQAHLGHCGEVLCMCQPLGVPMHVQRRNGHYILKRNPNTGNQHAPRCESFGGLPGDAQDVYEPEALAQTKTDGPIKVRLSMPLTTIASEPLDLPMTQAGHAPLSVRGKRSAVTLRGYMNLLWESAALHEYNPSTDVRRNYKAVRERLSQIADDHLILGGQQRMSERLFLPDVPPPETYQTKDENSKGVALLAKKVHTEGQIIEVEAAFALARKISAPNESPVILLLGELLGTHWAKTIPDSTAPRVCNITLKSSGPHHEIRDYAGVIEQMAKSNPGLVACALRRNDVDTSRPAHRIWMLLGVQLHETSQGTKFLGLVYGACLLCSNHHIPVESSYELQVADALQRQARHFKKPLRYEREKDSRPDFMLLDTPQPHAMEVFGFTGDAYEARARQKIDIAAGNGKPLWWWNPNKMPQLPPFPKPAVFI